MVLFRVNAHRADIFPLVSLQSCGGRMVTTTLFSLFTSGSFLHETRYSYFDGYTTSLDETRTSLLTSQ